MCFCLRGLIFQVSDKRWSEARPWQDERQSFSSPASGHVLFCGNWRKQQIWREQKTSKHTNWLWNESLNHRSNWPSLVLCSRSHFAPFSSKNMEEEQNRRIPQLCFEPISILQHTAPPLRIPRNGGSPAPVSVKWRAGPTFLVQTRGFLIWPFRFFIPGGWFRTATKGSYTHSLHTLPGQISQSELVVV